MGTPTNIASNQGDNARGTANHGVINIVGTGSVVGTANGGPVAVIPDQ